MQHGIPTYSTRNFMAMGTRFDMLVVNEITEKILNFENEVEQEISRLHQKYNRFDENSTLTLINNRAVKYSITTDNETFNLIQKCIHFNKLTLGAFDCTLGLLTDYYKTNNSHLKPVSELLNNCGINALELNTIERSIRFSKPDVCIDFGGILKGYALEQVKTIAQKHLISNLFVSFGESSILALGHHPFGTYWPVGIMHATQPQQTLHTFKLSGQAISTSGLTANNKAKTGHIVNPANGNAIKTYTTISVQATSAVDAEVVSTALLITPQSHHQQIINNFNINSAIEISYNNTLTPKIRQITGS